MDIKKLQRVIVDGLEDVKGQNILVFDTEHLSSLFERVIIASGTSNRQTKSLAASVRDAVKQAGFPVPRTEGEVNGEWIIVDCGAAVVHLMQPNIREYYHLEEIWGEKPVKLKLDAAPKRLVKAEEIAPEPKKKAPSRKAAASPAAAPAKKAPARKAAPEAEEAAPAAKRRAVATKTAAPAKRAAAPVKTGVTRTVGVKSTAAAKTPARKSPSAPSSRVAKKAPIKVIAVNKPSTKKAASARAAVNPAPAKRPAVGRTAAKSAAKPPVKRAPRSA
jgi:ribosome-associated protein